MASTPPERGEGEKQLQHLPDRPEAFRVSTPISEFDRSIWERFRSPFLLLLATGTAGVLVFAIAYVSYQMNQPPHRILKILIAGVGLFVILTRPGWALLLIPLTFPYIEWLPKSPVPMLNTMTLLISSLALALVARTVFQKERLLDPSPWNVVLGLFLGWGLFSTLQRVLIGGEGLGFAYASFQTFWQGFVGFVLFFVVYNNLRSMKQIRRLAFLYCVAAALGIFGLFWEYRGFSGGRRVAGGLGQVNIAAAFYACACIFTIEMLSGGFKKLWQRAVLAGSVAASAVGIVLPASRGALIAFLVAAVVQAVRSGPVRVIVLVALGIGLSLGAPDFFRARVTETWNAVRGDASLSEAFNEESGGRLDIWKAVIEVIERHPIVGVGYGQLSTAMVQSYGHSRAGHNLYLEVTAEMGIPGIVLLLALFGIGFYQGRFLLKHPGFPRALGLGYQYFVLALMVSNVFGGRLFNFSTCGAFSMLTAMVMRSRVLLEAPQAAAASASAGTGTAAGRTGANGARPDLPGAGAALRSGVSGAGRSPGTAAVPPTAGPGGHGDPGDSAVPIDLARPGADPGGEGGRRLPEASSHPRGGGR